METGPCYKALACEGVGEQCAARNFLLCMGKAGAFISLDQFVNRRLIGDSHDQFVEQLLIKAATLATTGFPFIIAYSVSLGDKSISDGHCELNATQLDVLKQVGSLLRSASFASDADIASCSYNITLGDIFKLGDA